MKIFTSQWRHYAGSTEEFLIIHIKIDRISLRNVSLLLVTVSKTRINNCMFIFNEKLPVWKWLTTSLRVAQYSVIVEWLNGQQRVESGGGIIIIKNKLTFTFSWNMFD